VDNLDPGNCSTASVICCGSNTIPSAKVLRQLDQTLHPVVQAVGEGVQSHIHRRPGAIPTTRRWASISDIRAPSLDHLPLQPAQPVAQTGQGGVALLLLGPVPGLGDRCSCPTGSQ
jgi:hypothetical protein